MVSLPLRSLKRGVWIANGVLAGGLVLAVAWLVAPLAENHPSQAGQSGSAETAATSPLAPPTLEQYAVIWQRDLLQPLYDPPTTTPVEAPPPPRPPLEVRLVGTTVEADNSFGFFIVPDKGTVLAGPGQMAGPVIVQSISHNSAVVKYGDELVTLTIQEPK